MKGLKNKGALTIGLVVCLLILLSGLGKPHLTPFTTGVKFDMLTAYDNGLKM